MKAVYVSHMGSDDSVVNAARVSFDKLAEMFSPSENHNLIRFLARGCSKRAWENLIASTLVATPEEVEEILLRVKHMAEHWTPFAHTAITLRMQAPIPIRTQCFKHKQGLVENEESRRYISCTPEVYVPDVFRSKPQGSVKQGSGGVHPESDFWKKVYELNTQKMVDLYMEMIADGVCPEQARFVLPQGCEVNWMWTGNLYAFANFYNKRSDSHAQKEIQELAHAVADVIAPLFPVSWDALTSKGASSYD